MGKEGKLIIRVIEAKLIHDTELMGAMDPYVIMKLAKLEQRTTVHPKGGKNPKWNQTFEFPLAKDGETLELSVWDKEDLKSDDFVGSGNLVLQIDLYRQKIPLPIPLFWGKKNEKGGELFIELHFVEKEEEDLHFLKELQKKNTLIVQNEKLMESIKEENESLTKENDNLLQEIKQKDATIEELKRDNSTLKEELSLLKENLARKDNEVSNSRKEMDKLFESLTAEKEKNIQLLKDFNERFLNEVSKMNGDQANLAKENKNFLEDLKKEKNKQHELQQEIDGKILEIGTFKLEIERLNMELTKERNNNLEEQKRLQEKDDELNKSLASNEQLKLSLTQEEAKVHELHVKLEATIQELAIEKDRTIETFQQIARKDSNLLEIASQKDKLSNDLLVENKQNARYLQELQTLKQEAIENTKIIENLRDESERQVNELVLLKKEKESLNIELNSETEKSKSLEKQKENLDAELKKMIAEKERTEQKEKESHNIFKEKENLFNLNFLKQLDQKKQEVNGALQENEQLKVDLKNERKHLSEARDEIFQKTNALNEKVKEVEKLSLEIMTLEQQKADLNRELVETRGEKDQYILDLSKEKERNIQFLQEIKQTEKEVADQKERVIEALKLAEKKDLEIAAIISERENEKLALQQEKSKIESFVQNINKLEQEILKEKENTKEAARETEKKTQEIINYFKEKEVLYVQLGTEKENNGKLNGEIQKLNGEIKTKIQEASILEEEVSKSKRYLADFLKSIETKANDIQNLVHEKLKN